MSYTAWIFLLVFTALTISSCTRESRIESRQKRLNTFRSVLPPDVRNEFDEITDRDNCTDVGFLLEEARTYDISVDAAIDSIVRAEMIDTFSNEEIVYFFWYYFECAIETGSVREF